MNLTLMTDNEILKHIALINEYGNERNHRIQCPTLSPAYDISPTFGYGHQMAINFKDKGVTQKDLLIMADSFDIKNAKEIIWCIT